MNNMKDKFEDKLLEEIIKDGFDMHRPLLSVYNNGRDIIRDRLTGAFYSYQRCPNMRAALDLSQWAGLSVDFDPKDAGNEPYEGYETTEWNGEAITEVTY